MKKRYPYFLIFTMAACMLAAVLFAVCLRPEGLPDCVRFRERLHDLPVSPYYDAAGDKYYLFLPAYASKEDISVSPAPYSGFQVTFSHGGGEDCASLADMPLEEDITVTASALLRTHTFTLRLQQCSGIPTVHLQAGEDMLTYLHKDKNNESQAAVTILDENGSPLLGDICTVSGRGNGSWSGEKRPYTLKFSDPITVGPFSDVESLCLLAEATDESKLRNALAYYGGQQLGIPYASPYQYINLYVNGEYRGLYGMVTKENYRKHIEADGIQAVFEISNGENKQEFWSSGMEKRIHILYGDTETVRQSVDSLEAALLSQDWERCAQLADLASFARKYALEEFFANFDLGFFSQYFYLDESGVLHCMLPWDYDWTLGSSISCFNDAQAFELRVFRTDSWYSRLLENDQFISQLLSVLNDGITDGFIASLEDHLSRCVSGIGGSRDCDRLRWGTAPEAYSSGLTELQDFSAFFRDYFPQRQAFLRSYFSDPDGYYSVSLVGNSFGTFFIPKGEDLMDHLGGTRILTGPVTLESPLIWCNDDGLTPESAGAKAEDVVFFHMYVGSAETEAPTEDLSSPLGKLAHYAGKLLILALFGLSALIIFLLNLWSAWKRPSPSR